MCYNPIQIQVELPRSKQTVIQEVSCRKCIECLQVRANEWGVRCHFELNQHLDNCFITLTYAETPIVLVKSEMQNFIKRLRKKIAPKKIKYFSCGEYGDQELRPHFHIIIFGYDFHDKTFVKMSKSNKAIYHSKELDQLWPYGLTTVQEANMQTVQYSAKYSMKQKKDLPEPLNEFPEFNTMSQGLGIQPILDRMETFLLTDEIYVDGFRYPIPNIVLEKYAKQLYPQAKYIGKNEKGIDLYYDWTDWVAEYKEKQEFHKVSKKDLETRKRLAIKKKQQQQLRTL